MALNLFKVKLVRIPKMRPIGWTQHQLTQVGETISTSMKTRIASGLNRFDAPMEPLAKSYKKRKTGKGKAGIRDMNFSGNMMGSMGVTDSSDHHVDVSFRGATPRLKARFRQANDAFFGMSPSDAVAADERLGHFMEINVKRAFRR